MSSEKSQAPFALRVGDKVRTPDGDGFVTTVLKWNHVVASMREPEAVEFGRVCAARFGKDWMTLWFRAYVNVGGRLGWYETSEVELVERVRDYGS